MLGDQCRLRAPFVAGAAASAWPGGREASGATQTATTTARQQGGTSMDNTQRDAEHWSATKGLMIKTLGFWLIFAFIIHLFAAALNGVVILGFPLGFYMAAQGSLIVFVVLLFWFASAQDAIDQRFGVAED
jgi:putative solute:sodium symporter small subunit